MKAPEHLGHKPIVSVNDYDKIDAQYRNKIDEPDQHNTDAKALSIGTAQYDENEISLKVWRYTGDQWSPQSEELPIHRNIDLNILLLGALMTDIGSGYPKTNLREVVSNHDEFEKIIAYYQANKKFLKPRLEELRDKLNDFLK